MDKLPYEIISIIIKKISIIQQFKLRLINKSFNNAFLLIKNDAYDFLSQQELKINSRRIYYFEPETINKVILSEIFISYNSIGVFMINVNDLIYDYQYFTNTGKETKWMPSSSNHDELLSDASYKLIESVQEKLKPLLLDILIELNKDDKLFINSLKSIKIE